MQLKFSWNDHFAKPHANRVPEDADMSDWCPLTCLLMDDGGLTPGTSLAWCQEGIARIEAVLSTGAGHPVSWDRETWGATITRQVTTVYSLHDERCAELFSTAAFHQVLVAWTTWLKAGEKSGAMVIDLNTTHAATPGRIVQTWHDGMRIVWSYVPDLPASDIRAAIPWLAVMRWEYDGADNQGMPGVEVNRRMLMLETVLEKVERPAFYQEVYRRISAGLREFVFYIADRDSFLETFNRYAAQDPHYPITIHFYRDEAWSELQDLTNDLAPADQPAQH